MNKIFFLITIIALSFNAMAQEKPKSKKEDRREQRKIRITKIVKQEEEGVITYKKQFSGGIKLTTDGYGAFLEIGRAQSVKKGLLFQLDISERKHPKEAKQQNLSNFGRSVPFIYGKTNFFYPVKLGVQEQFLLGNKSNKNGVSISANAGGGLILGLLRPYKVAVDSAGQTVYVGIKDDSAAFLNPGRIIGGPSAGTGFNKIKVNPGVYAKAALRFDYGKYNEMVSALEVGLTGEFYSKKVSQIAFQKNRQFFFSAFVAIIFGKRK